MRSAANGAAKLSPTTKVVGTIHFHKQQTSIAQLPLVTGRALSFCFNEFIFVVFSMKYQTPDSQSEILPNILGLSTAEDIALSEFEGFLKAEIVLTEKLSNRTKFDVSYILKIHKLALGHLYSFAGKYRDVNLSKGGFPFAAARFLPQTMIEFNQEVLAKLNKEYGNREGLIADIAKVHGELLFIHPFREGNGRTARILANLMSRKHGYENLAFNKVGEKEFEFYISAIQMSADKNYSKMEDFIASIFPG